MSTSPKPGALRGAELLKHRCASIPHRLPRIEHTCMPDIKWGAWLGKRIVVVGIGMSEGAAQLACVLWRQLGLNARCLPLSMTLMAPEGSLGDVLVVFSQGLSSNVGLALEVAHGFDEKLLVTSESCCKAKLEGWRGAGFECVSFPPDEQEDGLLLRVVGPTMTNFGLLRMTQHIERALDRCILPDLSTQALAQHMHQRFEATRDDASALACVAQNHRCVLLTIGQEIEMYHGLRWKLLEGLWIDVPPVLDALHFVHGPWQGVYDHETCFMVFHHGLEVELNLIERVRSMLQPHHTLIEIQADLPSPWDLFEYEAHLNGMICAHLSSTDLSLERWPGHQTDGALYDISSRAEVDPSLPSA